MKEGDPVLYSTEISVFTSENTVTGDENVPDLNTPARLIGTKPSFDKIASLSQYISKNGIIFALFQWRSMQINIIVKLTRVTKSTIVAYGTTWCGIILVLFREFYRGRPDWNLPYELTTKLVSGGKQRGEEPTTTKTYWFLPNVLTNKSSQISNKKGEFWSNYRREL